VSTEGWQAIFVGLATRTGRAAAYVRSLSMRVGRAPEGPSGKREDRNYSQRPVDRRKQVFYNHDASIDFLHGKAMPVSAR